MPHPSSATLNIAAYHFVSVPDAPALQQDLLAMSTAQCLKGTILIAGEGINLFLAGAPAQIEAFVHHLTQDPRFATLEIKRSWSEQQPFKKLLVKIKREIIRMNHPTIKPNFDPAQAQRAPAVDALTLKRWLDAGVDDEGQPVVMLDTRNAFEVDCGTFDNAVDWRIDKFSDFPNAFQAHRSELVGKTVVSFCTGGIRCEKAAIYMRQEGLSNVYQLDGGILKYFEATAHTSHPASVDTAESASDLAHDLAHDLVRGAATNTQHYHGTCFVFDERRELDPLLNPKR